MTTAELIEKLERAEGPSRELDLLIEWFPEGLPKGAVAGDVDLADRYGDGPPPYTASIDAAMTLVPGGWGYSIKVPSDELPMFIKQADMPKDARVWHNGVQHQGIAATPAIALCIASLKAKEADNG